VSSLEPTAPKRPPLQPKWIATILVLGIAYLLLRPFLVERFGWNLPGFTDVTRKPEGSEDTKPSTKPEKKTANNRPIEVPTIPEQSEPEIEDGVVAQTENSQPGAPQMPEAPENSKSPEKKSGTDSESDSSEEPPHKPERQVATAGNKSSDKPKTVPSGGKPPKPEAPKPSSGSNSNQTGNKKPPVAKPPIAKTPAAKPPSPKPESAKLGVLTPIGRDSFESTAGLIYRPERSEHRIDHVMQHSRDVPTKPVHGVFDGTRDEILALIDEAYMLAQTRGPPQVVTEEQGDRQTITVNLNRKIGYMGGENGERRGHPPLKMIKLVLEDRDLITAYPTNN
jgi:hypothetical protein